MADKSIDIEISADAGPAKRGLGEAAEATREFGREATNTASTSSGAFDRMSQSAETAGQRMSGAFGAAQVALGSLLAGVIQGAVSQLADLGKAAINTMVSFENLEIQLRSVMGGVEAGDKAFAWIKQFAKDTPFEVDQVTKSFMLLKNLGLDPMDGTLKALADQAAKSGQGAEGLERVALALGQAFTKGKLQGEEMNQMLEAGVPAWDMLAKATGKNVAELQDLSSKGRLGRDVIKALIEEIGRSSAGSSGAMMQSFTGLLSNLGDNAKNALDDVRKFGGGLEGLKGVLADINNAFQGVMDSGQLKTWATDVGQTFSAVVMSVWTVVREVGAIIGDIISTIGSGLGEIGKAISGTFGGEALSGVQIFVNVLKLVEIAAVSLGTGFNVLKELVSSAIEQAVIWVMRFGDTINAALQLDFDGAKAAWQAGGAQLADATDRALNATVAAAQAGRDKIDAIVSRPLSTTKTPEAAKGGATTTTERRNVKIEESTNAPKSRMGEFEAALAEKKAALAKEGAAEGQYRQMSLADEQAYWAKIAAMRGLSDADHRGAVKKAATLDAQLAREGLDAKLRALQEESAAIKNNAAEKIAIEQRMQAMYAAGSKEYEAHAKKIVEIQRQAAEQQRQIDAIKAKSATDAALAQVAAEEQQAKQSLQMGTISQAEMLAQMEAFEARRYEVKLAALNERIALLEADPDASPVKLAELHAQIQQLEQQHALAVGQIRGQQLQQSMATWNTISQSMESGLVRVGQTMLTNWRSVGSALRSVMAGIGQTIITETILKPLAAKAAAWVKEKALTMAGIGADAAKAGSGAAASQASVPVVGPVLALAAMAAVFAGVMALSGGMKSARNGYDIPAGVNPLTQLHEKEMVLPAEHADTIRGLGKSGAQQEPAQSHNYNVTYNDNSGQLTQAAIRDNARTIANELQRLQRGFFKPGT